MRTLDTEILNETNAELLLIDDDPGYRYLVKLVLGALPFKTSLSVLHGSGKVLAYLRKEDEFAASPTPNLIILDRMLTPKDGLAVLTEIKRDQKLNPIPVIMMSGHSNNGVVNEAYRLGVSSYLRKPDSLEGFIETFRVMLNYWLVHASLPTIFS
jgi:two-component system, chemotaxis family, response regulator Rcp1